MPEIEISNLYKSYGAVEVIHGVTTRIPEGQFVVLVGPSGCGKSTLRRMIAGLEEVSDGEIFIDGRLVNDLAPKDRDIAMVFQNYALYPHLTVKENMSFSMQMRGARRSTYESIVAKTAGMLGLDKVMERFPQNLSGGQRQRVAMGRAIVRDPAIYLFDEPLSNLDAKLRVQMRTEIRELQQRMATTTVYVTHDQIEAMTMADLIIVMRDGRIEQYGSPLEIYDHPANLFVAQFIGAPTINLLHGRMVKRHSGLAFQTAAGVLIERMPECAPIDGEVVVAVRPEHVRLAEDGFAAQVRLVETTGPEVLLHCIAGSDAMTIALRDRVGISAGATVRLTFDAGRAHIFDGQSGRRLDTPAGSSE